MTPIELCPAQGGPAIVGTWNAQGVLYLTGQGGTLQWSAEILEGTAPLAVVFRCHDSVTIAPVHPLCRVDRMPHQLRLGTETYDVRMTVSKWRRPMKHAAMAGILIVVFACGWWLHSLASRASPVVVPLQEESYVF